MTKSQIKKEFCRWMDEGNGEIWYKKIGANDWNLTEFPSWSLKYNYLVNDKHAELRKLQIDEPNTRFEEKSKLDGQWYNIDIYSDWDLDCEYRIRIKKWYKKGEAIGKPVWVRDKDNEDWRIAIFTMFVVESKYPFYCGSSCYKQIRPVTKEDLYQDETIK